MSALTNMILYNSTGTRTPFNDIHDLHVCTPQRVEKDLRESSAHTLWIMPEHMALDFCKVVLSLSFGNKDFIKIFAKANKLPMLLLFEEPTGVSLSILDQLFRRIVIAKQRSFLNAEEIATVLSSKRRDEMVLGGEVDLQLGALTLTKGDSSLVVVPLEIFRPTAGVHPDFHGFEIIDHGHTIKFGDYEASVDAVLYEVDPNYRKKMRKNLIAEEKTFGASLKRLRMQKKLNQSDFRPYLSEKTIQRLESNTAAPSENVLRKLSKVLKVDPNDIESF